MLSGGMLVSALTLLPSSLVWVSSCPFLSGYAVWLWLLSLGLCPPGVLGTTLVNLCSLCEDMRSMYAFAPGRSASSCLNAGPQLLVFLLCFHSLYAVFRLSSLPPLGVALYGLRL